MRSLPGRATRSELPEPAPNLTRETVAQEQRRRIRRATGELVAKRGYSGVSVELITKRMPKIAVSRASRRPLRSRDRTAATAYSMNSPNTIDAIASARNACRFRSTMPARIGSSLRAASSAARRAATFRIALRAPGVAKRQQPAHQLAPAEQQHGHREHDHPDRPVGRWLGPKHRRGDYRYRSGKSLT